MIDIFAQLKKFKQVRGQNRTQLDEILKNFIVFFTCFISISCQREYRPDIVYDDFESGNFKNWDKLGSTFYSPTHIDSTELRIKNFQGNYFAISDNEDPSDIGSQGKLVSKKFLIERKYINFLIGGGNHKERESVNLIIDNNIEFRATGENTNILRPVMWDVSKYIDKLAYIEIVDALSSAHNENALPYLIVDDIVFSDNKGPKQMIFENFESGTYNNWNIQGNAFTIPRNRTNVYYPISASGFRGTFFASSFGDTHDIEKGILSSKEFEIRYDYIKFLVGGGSHTNKTCINLLVNDTIIFTQTGMDDGEMREYHWDVRNYIGKKGKIEIVDDHSSTWGHIMVDEIIFYNEDTTDRILLYSLALLIAILAVIGIRHFKYSSRQKNKFHKSELTEEELNTIAEIKAFVYDNGLFKDPNPNVREIEKFIGLNSEEINSLFENAEERSLMNLINILRVEEFKKELNDPSNEAYTLLAIAYKCGFSSKSSFYRIFKNITHITPSEYKNSLK